MKYEIGSLLEYHLNPSHVAVITEYNNWSYKVVGNTYNSSAFYDSSDFYSKDSMHHFWFIVTDIFVGVE